jgi:hypothetical protein
MNSYVIRIHMKKLQLTFDSSTDSGLGAFQIFNQNITSILKSMYPSEIEFVKV